MIIYREKNSASLSRNGDVREKDKKIKKEPAIARLLVLIHYNVRAIIWQKLFCSRVNDWWLKRGEGETKMTKITVSFS